MGWSWPTRAKDSLSWAIASSLISARIASGGSSICDSGSLRNSANWVHPLRPRQPRAHLPAIISVPGFAGMQQPPADLTAQQPLAALHALVGSVGLRHALSTS